MKTESDTERTTSSLATELEALKVKEQAQYLTDERREQIHHRIGQVSYELAFRDDYKGVL